MESIPYRIVPGLLANQLAISLTGIELSTKQKGTTRSSHYRFCTANAIKWVAGQTLIGSDSYETSTSVSDSKEAYKTVIERKLSQLKTSIEKMTAFRKTEVKVRNKRYLEYRWCHHSGKNCITSFTTSILLK